MLAAALLAGAAARISAQRLAPERFAAGRPTGAAPARDSAAPVPSVNLVLGGVAGGIVGGFLGATAGYYLGGGGKQCGDDSCGVLGGVVGFLVGEPLGVGAGVHLGDRARGNALLDVLGAAGVGYLALFASHSDPSGPLLAAAAIAQVGVAVGIERATAR